MKFKIRNIEVFKTRNRGLGVRTLIARKKDEIIEIAPILLFDNSSSQLLEMTKLKYYSFETEEGAGIALGYASLYNHSPHPNCEYIISDAHQLLTISALQDIPAGEELTINYGWNEEMYEGFNYEFN